MPSEIVSLLLVDALGCRCARETSSPHSTPLYDTSAMDGFAMCSSLTAHASSENPIRFRVVDFVAAGDSISPHAARGVPKLGPDQVCVEIMTGARFPESTHPEIDAVIKIEDINVIGDEPDCEGRNTQTSRFIVVSKPVLSAQNRRPAGSDFVKGEVLVYKEEIIEPRHIAALASLGISRIEVSSGPEKMAKVMDNGNVVEELRVGILPTGSELVDITLGPRRESDQRDDSEKTQIPDSNGPYLVSALRASGITAQIQHLGIADDAEEVLLTRISQAVHDQKLDVVVTSGGVSMGRFDLVRHIVETRMRGQVVFHGVKVRPGMPVFFALIKQDLGNGTGKASRTTAFFGLPGNPLAAAMALRFFVIPYLSILETGAFGGLGTICTIVLNNDAGSGTDSPHGQGNKDPKAACARRKPAHLVVCWLAKRKVDPAGNEHIKPGLVSIVDDQASYKLRGLLQADCWVVAPAGVDTVCERDRLIVSPL
jgi:molybdopterin molybdotransferase